MRALSVLFWLLLLGALIGMITLGYACLSPTPLVADSPRLTAANVERAKSLLREHDVRLMQDDEVKTIVIKADELSLLANHLIQRLGDGGADIRLDNEGLKSAATLGIKGLSNRRYLNFDTAFTAENGRATLARFRIGTVSFPPAAAQALMRFAVLHLMRSAGISDQERVIQQVALSGQDIAVTYQWKTAIVDAVREQILSADDVKRLAAYNDYLVGRLEKAGRRVQLTELLGDVFTHAQTRSAPNDAVIENRMALTMLTMYLNGRRLSSLVPQASGWTKPKRVSLVIHGRHDLARHFVTSAGLAVAGGGATADAIGLYKEIDDADGGSGFSFKDLAADRAGTRFAKAAGGSENSAREIQQRCSEGLAAVDLVPDLSGLEENLDDGEFAARYGEVGSDVYQSVVDTIDARISASSLYAD